MRIRGRYIKIIVAVAVLCLIVFLLQSQLQEPEYEKEMPLGQYPVDSSLDELLDESFTHPPESITGNRVDVGRLPSGVLNFGIVEQLPSPLCPPGSLSAPVSARVRVFQPLIEGGDDSSPLYLYSASITVSHGSVSSSLTVEALGVMEPKFHAGLFCQLWYRSGPRPLSLIPARFRTLAERQSGQSASVDMRSVIMHCTETDVEMEDRVPYAVSVVGSAHLCGDPVLILPFLGSPNFVSDVVSAQSDADRSGIAVCSPTPLNDLVLDPAWLQEWLEAQRVMGAGRVFLYHLQTDDSNLARVLHAYTRPSQTGMVTLLDWPLPHDVAVTDNGRTVAINDCLQRAAREKFWRVLIADVNKIVVPSSKFTDWHALIIGLDSTGTSDVMLLQSARTMVADADEREAMGGSPLKISIRQRSAELSSHGQEANMFVNPLKVESVGGNGQLLLRRENATRDDADRVRKLEIDEALVLDFDISTGLSRSPSSDREMVIDERMAPFTFRFIAAVRASRAAMKN